MSASSTTRLFPFFSPAWIVHVEMREADRAAASKHRCVLKMFCTDVREACGSEMVREVDAGSHDEARQDKVSNHRKKWHRGGHRGAITCTCRLEADRTVRT
jgi:hypothetical protein